jgi:hypothetical protein
VCIKYLIRWKVRSLEKNFGTKQGPIYILYKCTHAPYWHGNSNGERTRFLTGRLDMYYYRLVSCG